MCKVLDGTHYVTFTAYITLTVVTFTAIQQWRCYYAHFTAEEMLSQRNSLLSHSA